MYREIEMPEYKVSDALLIAAYALFKQEGEEQERIIRDYVPLDDEETVSIRRMLAARYKQFRTEIVAQLGWEPK